MTSDPDEITTDVDPSWVASIRAGKEPAESGPSAEASPGDEPLVAGGDWTEIEPVWDPEATVGVADGLLERIRQEIGAPAPPPAGPPAPPVRTPPPTPAPPATPDAPSIPATTPEALVEQLASTTVRWEPRQRLTATAPVNDTSVIAAPTTPGIDRTKVAIAAIAAMALIVVAWLFIGSRGGDEAPPTIDSVPTSEDAPVGGSTIPAVSGPTPAPVDLDDGAGG